MTVGGSESHDVRKCAIQRAPSLGVDSMVIVNTAWLRLLVSFIRVLAVVRFMDPVRSTPNTSCTLRASTYTSAHTSSIVTIHLKHGHRTDSTVER